MSGQPIYANKYGIKFRQKSSSVQPMNLFTGSNTADSFVAWTLGDTTRGNTPAETTLIGTKSFYVFDSCMHFDWINCDHFLDSSAALTSIYIKCADTNFNIGNTMTYVIFPPINSVMNAMYSVGERYSSTADNVPVGMVAKVVTISYYAGHFYYSSQDITVTAGMHITASPVVHDINYINSVISVL